MSVILSYKEGEYNKIGAIVDHVLFKKGLPDTHFQWLLEMGLWELRQLKLVHVQDVKTECLAVSDRKTVLLPGNFVDWVVVAMPVGQYYITIGVNPKLQATQRTNSDDIVAGLLSQNLPNGLDFGSYGGYPLFNFGGSSLFSVGGGFKTKGMFRLVDHGMTKELLMDYDYPSTHVYLEYITDGFDPCGETIVNSYLADFVKKAMEKAWEEERNPRATEASVLRKTLDLRDALKLVRACMNDLDPQTLLNLQRQETRFTPHI